MSRNPIEAAPNEIMSRFEWQWLWIGMTALAVILFLSVGFMITHPGSIPMTTQVAPMTTVLASEMFQHPGLTKTGPKRFQAVVVARQYGFTPAEIAVPVGARVDFYLTSADVVHGFEIPGQNVNVEVFPGYVAHVYTTFRTRGSYVTVCDQYCGIGHQNMLTKLSVLDEADYERAARNVAPPTGQAGLAVFTSNCSSCHQAAGQGVAGAFPPLADSLHGYTNDAAGRLVLTHILLDGLQGPIEVDRSKYNGMMPAWGSRLTDRQIADVLNYITTAWKNGSPGSSRPETFVSSAIAAARVPALSPTSVAAERAKLPTL